MSNKWRLGLWLASSALVIIGPQLKGWAEPLVCFCAFVLMLWPVVGKFLPALGAMTRCDSVLDKPISGGAGRLASGLALILFLGSMLLIALPEQNKRARNLGEPLMLCAFGLIFWAGLGKRQER
jgi:hypothetical protein